MGRTKGTGRQRLVVVWDVPNMDMRLGGLLGGLPTAAKRPRFDRIAEWIARRAAGAGLEPTATAFINVSPQRASTIDRFVRTLRSAGFGVYARPKQMPGDDIDAAMVRHLREAIAGGDVAEVIVASHDGRAFGGLLRQLTSQGVRTSVLGFRESARWVSAVEGLGFIDLESIEGCFQQPLERVDLTDLPPTGAMLHPHRALASWRPATGVPPEDVASPELDGVALVLQALTQLAEQSETGWVRKVKLHPMLKQLDPAFTPERYGHATLRGLVKACGSKVRTRQVPGDHELALAT